jgi:hypothetical protein
MAEHIDGPLYYETMGKSGPVMAFVHPNPMDQGRRGDRPALGRAARRVRPVRKRSHGRVAAFCDWLQQRQRRSAAARVSAT